MAVENFTTYTEVDPNSRIAKTSTRVTCTDLRLQDKSYVYIDKTANYFDGDFVHYLTACVTNRDNSVVNFWALANSLGTLGDIDNANGDMLCIYGSTVLNIKEVDGGDLYTSASYTVSIGTPYYLKIVRDESVGTYGTLYCYIYSDAARTTLLDTLSLALHTSTKDYRYLYGMQAYYLSGTSDDGISGYTEDLELLTLSTPTVTTQAVTNIVTTTATGNGTVTSLGNFNPTAHGVCWNTTGTPTTASSHTDDGAVSATGAFTTTMTGLTAGTKYYVRAYATNTEGTGYGNQVEFTAGKGTVFPINPLLRVSGIRRTFWSGLGGQAVYQCELALGGMTTSYVPPIGSRDIPSAVTPTEAPEVGSQQADYQVWLNYYITYNISGLIKTFGHIPLYEEWLAWKQSPTLP